uniref:Uncharacterized protein n=1 Tax=Panagrolaimus davidi TaxID=227884 RepID=A0A914Q567_9BILA
MLLCLDKLTFFRHFIMSSSDNPASGRDASGATIDSSSSPNESARADDENKFGEKRQALATLSHLALELCDSVVYDKERAAHGIVRKSNTRVNFFRNIFGVNEIACDIHLYHLEFLKVFTTGKYARKSYPFIDPERKAPDFTTLQNRQNQGKLLKAFLEKYPNVFGNDHYIFCYDYAATLYSLVELVSFDTSMFLTAQETNEAIGRHYKVTLSIKKPQDNAFNVVNSAYSKNFKNFHLALQGIAKTPNSTSTATTPIFATSSSFSDGTSLSGSDGTTGTYLPTSNIILSDLFCIDRTLASVTNNLEDMNVYDRQQKARDTKISIMPIVFDKNINVTKSSGESSTSTATTPTYATSSSSDGTTLSGSEGTTGTYHPKPNTVSQFVTPSNSVLKPGECVFYGRSLDSSLNEECGISTETVDKFFREMFERGNNANNFGWIKSAYTAERGQTNSLNGVDPEFRRHILGNKDSSRIIRIMSPVYFEFTISQQDLPDKVCKHFVIALFTQNPPRAYYLDPAHQTHVQNVAYNHVKSCVEHIWNVNLTQVPQDVSNPLVDKQGKNDYCAYHVMHLGKQIYNTGMPYIDPAFNIDQKKLEIDNQLKEYQSQRKAECETEREEFIDRLTNP